MTIEKQRALIAKSEERLEIGADKVEILVTKYVNELIEDLSAEKNVDFTLAQLKEGVLPLKLDNQIQSLVSGLYLKEITDFEPGINDDVLERLQPVIDADVEAYRVIIRQAMIKVSSQIEAARIRN